MTLSHDDRTINIVLGIIIIIIIIIIISTTNMDQMYKYIAYQKQFCIKVT